MDNIPFNKHLVEIIANIVHQKHEHDRHYIEQKNDPQHTHFGLWRRYEALDEADKNVNRQWANKILSAIFDGG